MVKLAPSTVCRRIVKISQSIEKPTLFFNKLYELDELCTYVGKKSKRIWIAYALRRDTKEIVDFVVGSRTNRTLSKVIECLHLSDAKRIYTDKLKNYKYLIDPRIHSTKPRGTNGIERMNLNLRTHLKRLSRRTICFSRSVAMVIASLKIYFWS